MKGFYDTMVAVPLTKCTHVRVPNTPEVPLITIIFARYRQLPKNTHKF